MTVDQDIIRRIFGARYSNRLTDRGEISPIWDAYTQGQYARATGVLKSANPHFHPALPYHINVSDWNRGWDAGVPEAAP